MNFSYSDEQQMLRDSIAKFVQNDYDFDSRCSIVASDQGYSAEHWSLFAELGWLMVPFTEADGGLGGSAIDLTLVMEELGRGIVVEPYLANTILAGGAISLAADSTQKETLLGEIMAGSHQFALAYAEPNNRYSLDDIKTEAKQDGQQYTLTGTKAVVINGQAADKFIVSAKLSGGVSLFLVEADAAVKSSYRTIDGARAADVTFTNAPAQLLGEQGQGLEALQQTINRAIIAVCAEAVGAMSVALEKTVEYSKTRVQFGVPISKFQALQHRMADMFVEQQQAKSIVMMAAMACDSGQDVAKAVSAAKSRVGKAARLIGQEAVQIHGGIAVTDELDLGHYFKRLTAIELMFGGTDYHTQKFAKSS